MRCGVRPDPSVSSVVRKKRNGRSEDLDAPIDLASRIGMPARSAPAPVAPETARRVDGPIESDRPQRGRPLMIGADEPPPAPAIETPEPERTALAVRPMVIRLQEAFAAEPLASEPTAAPILVTREAPAAGEMDLVVMPLATPDDWHHFELALRRVPGVGALRIEYYRAGILKLRLRWSGPRRFADAVANVPGYRVGILGEDRSTVQIRVVRA